MKLTWVAIIAFILLILALGFFVGKSCTEKEIIVQTNFNEEIAKIDKRLDEIALMQDSIINQRILHQTFNKYEITKMDSLISVDSAWVNAIIRARNEHLIKLSGFFQIGTDTNRTMVGDKNPTGW